MTRIDIIKAKKAQKSQTEHTTRVQKKGQNRKQIETTNIHKMRGREEQECSTSHRRQQPLLFVL